MSGTTTTTGTTVTVTGSGTGGTTTTVYTTKAGLPIPQANQANWHLPLQAIIATLDASPAIGPFAVTPSNPGTSSPLPSSSLNVNVGGGTFLNASGTPVVFSGSLGIPLSASSTTRLWLDDTGVLYSGSAYPTSTQMVPLATVTTGTASVTAISDDRVLWRSYGGSSAGYVAKAGDTLGDGANFVFGTTTGSRLGTASTQKIAFFGATPIVQPANTSDLRTALVSLGLLGSGGSNPLNLNGGTLTGAVQLPVTPISSSMALSTLGVFTISAPGNITITLPDAASNAGGLVIFKRTDSTSNTVTISRAGTDTIDGGTTNTSLSTQWAVLRLVAVSGQWLVF